MMSASSVSPLASACLFQICLSLFNFTPPSQMDFFCSDQSNAHISFIESISMSILGYLNYEKKLYLKRLRSEHCVH